MTEHFDIVVAGAGHNSLITAAYLAKAGGWRQYHDRGVDATGLPP